MVTVFQLLHLHHLDEESADTKLIGFYRTCGVAEEAITRLSVQPGFRDAPDGFEIWEFEVDQDYWSHGYETVDGEDVELTGEGSSPGPRRIR